MKFLGQGIALTLLGAGLAAIPGLAATAAPTTPSVENRSLVQQMKDEATGRVSFSKTDATGKVGFVRVAKGGDLLDDTSGSAVAKSDSAVAVVESFGVDAAAPSHSVGAVLVPASGRGSAAYVHG